MPVVRLLLVVVLVVLVLAGLDLFQRPQMSAPAAAPPRPAPYPPVRHFGEGQVFFCVRGLCAGPEHWAWRSLRHARAFARERGARRVLLAELRQVRRALAERPVIRTVQATDWRAKQIAAAETIARESAGDPWPNCPDPYDGSGASWDQTAACENGGNWLDSPGYYRCGLQFDPGWETRFGRLCP